jgi:ABC-type nitrate/sulfonate/bicarbonate transport system substrate-binding protein
MVNLAVAGVADLKIVTVTINRIEHVFVVRKNIAKPEDLKGKRLAVSRIGSASDTITRMVLRSWKIDPDKETILLQSGNTPTRMTALAAGHVDGALVSPESVHKIVASGCCRILAISPTCRWIMPATLCVPASYIKTLRETLRRLLMAYLEGQSMSTEDRPKSVYAAPRRERYQGSGSPKRSIYQTARARVCANIPCGISNGIQKRCWNSLPHPKARKWNPARCDGPRYSGRK